MAEVRHFWHLARTAPRSDVNILQITFGLTVLTDIVIAVNVGVILSSSIFLQRHCSQSRPREYPRVSKQLDCGERNSTGGKH